MNRTENKQVYVMWPGGSRTGPHTQTFKDYENDVEVWVNGKTVIIPGDWTEEVKPKLEPGRLVYIDADGQKTYGEYKENNASFHEIKNGGMIWPTDIQPIPVNRRWNEITPMQYNRLLELFKEIVDGYCEDLEHVYKMFYDMISIEEHP